jgi:chemotaxis protein CheD
LTAIHVGGIHVAAERTTIRTVLGSCIAVCLHDPALRTGGMNHFMLPRLEGRAGENTRFGEDAMEELVARMQKLGSERRRLVAKVFGGGHVLSTAESADSVPRRNIDFIDRFMAAEGIRVASRDLGGRFARELYFDTASGRAWVRRLRGEACRMGGGAVSVGCDKLCAQCQRGPG